MNKEYKDFSSLEKILFLKGKPKLYCVIVEDKHTDVGAEIFTDREVAIAYAKGICKEYAKDPADIKEMHIPAWEYYCSYNCEDSVRVEVKILDAMEDQYGTMS